MNVALPGRQPTAIERIRWADMRQLDNWAGHKLLVWAGWRCSPSLHAFAGRCTRHRRQGLRERVPMLSDDLLDAYATAIPPITAMEPRAAAAPKVFAALRAVLDLHHPMAPAGDERQREGDFCDECASPWPCDTRRVITAALEAP